MILTRYSAASWRRQRRTALVVLLTVGGMACRATPTDLDRNADLTVLFIGNSLTASNDLPSMTRAVAAAGGRTLSHATWLAPNVSLEDHANAGATPALLMVWPDGNRLFAFDDVYASYRGDAQAVGGIFIPAGDVWRAVWRRDPDAALYGPDNFHPSRLGSLVTALTIYAVPFDADVRLLPRSIAPDIPSPQLERILDAVHEAVVTTRGTSAGTPARQPRSSERSAVDTRRWHHG